MVAPLHEAQGPFAKILAYNDMFGGDMMHLNKEITVLTPKDKTAILHSDILPLIIDEDDQFVGHATLPHIERLGIFTIPESMDTSTANKFVDELLSFTNALRYEMHLNVVLFLHKGKVVSVADERITHYKGFGRCDDRIVLFNYYTVPVVPNYTQIRDLTYTVRREMGMSSSHFMEHCRANILPTLKKMLKDDGLVGELLNKYPISINGKKENFLKHMIPKLRKMVEYYFQWNDLYPCRRCRV